MRQQYELATRATANKEIGSPARGSLEPSETANGNRQLYKRYPDNRIRQQIRKQATQQEASGLTEETADPEIDN